MKNVMSKVFEFALASVIVVGMIHIAYKQQFVPGRQGILEAAGSASEYVTNTSDSPGVDADASYTAEISYLGKRIYLNEPVNILSLFDIKAAGGTEFINGVNEPKFQLYLSDVKDAGGNSVLTLVDSIPAGITGAPFEYCESTQMFRSGSKGVYKVMVEIYDELGNSQKKKLTLMVIQKESKPPITLMKGRALLMNDIGNEINTEGISEPEITETLQDSEINETDSDIEMETVPDSAGKQESEKLEEQESSEKAADAENPETGIKPETENENSKSEPKTDIKTETDKMQTENRKAEEKI